LHLQDHITIENKVIKRLVEEKAVPELIFTPPVRPARKTNKWLPNLRTKKPKRHSMTNTKTPIGLTATAVRR
jgi:hypothetical protein